MGDGEGVRAVKKEEPGRMRERGRQAEREAAVRQKGRKRERDGGWGVGVFQINIQTDRKTR